VSDGLSTLLGGASRGCTVFPARNRPLPQNLYKYLIHGFLIFQKNQVATPNPNFPASREGRQEPPPLLAAVDSGAAATAATAVAAAAAEVKHAVDPAEFFVYRHQYKQGPKNGEWVDSRSKAVHVSYILYIYVLL
jgi:hypothetical protein